MEGEALRASPESGSDDDEVYGQRLLEVLSVHVNGGRSPSGSVTVFDGKRGQKIYSRDAEPAAASTSPPRLHQNELLLTGPYRAISADGCVAFVLNLPDEKAANRREILVDLYDPATKYDEPISKAANRSEILVDLYDPATKYDEPISAKVDTGYGRAEVKYALLSNAVECGVQVKLLLGDASVPAYAHGTIVARSELLQHDIVLFDGEITRATSPELIVPLARSVLAVPLMWPLEIKVDLRGCSGEEIVKDYVKFCPGNDAQLVSLNLVNNRQVQVTIAWSDEEDYYSLRFNL